MPTLTYPRLAALVLVASSCRLTAGVGATRSVAATTTSPPVAGSSTDVAASADPNGQTGRRIAGSSADVAAGADRNGLIFQAEMASLKGLTVDQAKQWLAGIGHTGNVIVEELIDFLPGCQQGTVCVAAPEGGTAIDRDITLRINRVKLQIAAPPP